MAVKKSKSLKTKKTANISCLVTGFDPFFGQPFNPSEVIAQSMPAELTLAGGKIKVPVKHLVLPVVGGEAWRKLKPVLKKMNANKQICVVIQLGLAGKRNNINLERFALNIRDDIRPDNKNRLVHNERLVKSAPEAYRTKAPIEDSLKRLSQKGLPAEISNFAGTFICNDVYFHTLHYFEEKKSRQPYSAVFIHLPLPEIYGKTIKEKGTTKTKLFSKGKDKQMAAILEAVKTVAGFNCEYLLKQMS